MINDRIKAHRSAPDVYDPPTFDQMADRIAELEAKLDWVIVRTGGQIRLGDCRA
jgi:hypothetical protein